MISDQSAILGAPSATADHVVTYMLARPHDGYGADAIRDVIVPAYFRVCGPVGVDPVLALAQMIHETGNLTSFWSLRPQRNPAGIGVNGQRLRSAPPACERALWSFNTQRKIWERGLSFVSWENDAVIAHVGRLLAYALAPGQASDAQRALIQRAMAYRPLPAAIWGSAPRLRQLGKRHNPTGNGWASPGDRYGAQIAEVACAIAAVSAPSRLVVTPTLGGADALLGGADELFGGTGDAAPAGVTIVDMRACLPRKPWSIGTRSGPPTSVTLHYNGPPLANRSREGELAKAVANAKYHMRPGAFGVKDGADGLQYHFVVLSDGTIAQTRDLEAVLWHCGHHEGNHFSIAVHLPLGGDQDATPRQWEATVGLFDYLIARYKLAGRHCVKGHQEWKKKDCPGPLLMRRLIQWRKADPQAPPPAPTQPQAGQYRVAVREANVRKGPGVGFAIALVVRVGELIEACGVVSGDCVNGDDRWVQRADGLGFMHMSVVELVPAAAPGDEDAVLGGAAEEPALRFLVLFDDLPVRAEPTTESAAVATLCRGEVVGARGLVVGQPLGDCPCWTELLEPAGFVHEHLLRQVETL